MSNTKASCDDCGFSAKALDYFSRADITTIASPIDYRHVSAAAGGY